MIEHLREEGDLDAASAMAVMGVLNGAFGAVFSYLYLGLQRMGLAALRGQRVASGDLFGAGPVFVSGFVAAVLVEGLTGLGVLLCILPGIIWALAATLTPLFVIDKGLLPLAAIKASFAATYGWRVRLLFFSLGALLVMLLGMLALGIGLFVAFPMIVIAQAAIYERLWPQARPAA